MKIEGAQLDFVQLKSNLKPFHRDAYLVFAFLSNGYGKGHFLFQYQTLNTSVPTTQTLNNAKLRVTDSW